MLLRRHSSVYTYSLEMSKSERSESLFFLYLHKLALSIHVVSHRQWQLVTDSPHCKRFPYSQFYESEKYLLEVSFPLIDFIGDYLIYGF